jgi:hypothetical protein
MVINGQNRDLAHSRAIFLKLKIQSAPFLNRIDSLHVKHKKKPKNVLVWQVIWHFMVGFITPRFDGTAGPKKIDEIFFWTPKKGLKS